MKVKPGFTLMELLIALAVFGAAVLILTDTYAVSIKAQRQSATKQKVLSDARLIINTLADQIRQGTIDYKYYSTEIRSPVEVLALIDKYNKNLLYRKSSEIFSETVCPSKESTPCLEISADNGATWNSVTAKEVKIQSLKFILAPGKDPFVSGGPNVQPRVTISLALSGQNAILSDTIFLQTTISSRTYQR